MEKNASEVSADSLEASRKSWAHHPGNPFTWPESKKWRILLVAAAATLLIGINASSVTTPASMIAERFHVTESAFPHSFWPVTIWNTGAAFGPMVGLPLLENFGIQRGYMVNRLNPTEWLIG